MVSSALDHVISVALFGDMPNLLPDRYDGVSSCVRSQTYNKNISAGVIGKIVDLEIKNNLRNPHWKFSYYVSEACLGNSETDYSFPGNSLFPINFNQKHLAWANNHLRDNHMSEFAKMIVNNSRYDIGRLISFSSEFYNGLSKNHKKTFLSTCFESASPDNIVRWEMEPHVRELFSRTDLLEFLIKSSFRTHYGSNKMFDNILSELNENKGNYSNDFIHCFQYLFKGVGFWSNDFEKELQAFFPELKKMFSGILDKTLDDIVSDNWLPNDKKALAVRFAALSWIHHRLLLQDHINIPVFGSFVSKILELNQDNFNILGIGKFLYENILTSDLFKSIVLSDAFGKNIFFSRKQIIPYALLFHLFLNSGEFSDKHLKIQSEKSPAQGKKYAEKARIAFLQFKIPKFYKEGSYYQVLLKGLSVLDDSPLEGPLKLALIEQIFKNENKLEQKNQWSLLHGLLKLDILTQEHLEAYACQTNNEITFDLNRMYFDAFNKEFDIDESQQINYEGTFGKHADHFSLFAYLGGIKKSIVEIEKENVLSLFKQFVHSVVTVEPTSSDRLIFRSNSENPINFYNLRYNKDPNVNLHLATIFGKYPGLEDAWVQNERLTVDSDWTRRHKVNTQTQVIDFQAVLYDKIVKHGDLDRTHYAMAYRALQTPNNKAAELKSLEESLITIAEGPNSQKKEQLLEGLAINKLLIELSYLNSGKHLPRIRKLLSELMGKTLISFTTSPLFSQLKSIQAELNKKDLSDPEVLKDFLTHCQLEKTDHFWRLFMSGDVGGSCQNVNSSFSTNKCLMAYVADGKNFLLMLTKNGKMEARCILRLLWDEENGIPVLFKEDNYSSHSLFSKILDIYAEQVARELGLTLMVKSDNLDKLEDTSDDIAVDDKPSPIIAALGGPKSAYEYVDALHRQIKGCEFEIRKSRVTVVYQGLSREALLERYGQLPLSPRVTILSKPKLERGDSDGIIITEVIDMSSDEKVGHEAIMIQRDKPAGLLLSYRKHCEETGELEVVGNVDEATLDKVAVGGLSI